MIKVFNDFIKYDIEEGYLRRIVSSEINKEERSEDNIRKEEKLKRLRKNIEFWLDKNGIDNYTIDDKTLEIDVDGDVDLRGHERFGPKIEGGKLPDYIKFRKVNGRFNCSHNNLTSLEGCPNEIYGGFDCSHNNLTSLEGCPKNKCSWLDCTYNKITSLKGCPDELRVIYCSIDFLENFETGYSNKIKVDFVFLYCYEDDDKNNINRDEIKKEVLKHFDLKKENIIFRNI